MAGIAGILLLVLVLVAWAYDAGRRMAGFDRMEEGETLAELRSANAMLEKEQTHLRSQLSSCESNLQIEKSTQKLLSEKNAALLNENAKLREELAVFERLTKHEVKEGDAGVTIDRLNLRPEGKGRYRYSFLIALQGTRRGKEAKFNLQLVVVPKNGAGSRLIFPENDATDLPQYNITLRNFRRIEGIFAVPTNIAIDSLEVNILEGGRVVTSKRIVVGEMQNVWQDS